MSETMEVSNTDPLVRVRNLKVAFQIDKGTIFEAVKGVSFDVPRNRTVALVGESGSGKSVTSLAILGLLPPENSIVDPASEILYDGRNLARLHRQNDPVERRGHERGARSAGGFSTCLAGVTDGSLACSLRTRARTRASTH